MQVALSFPLARYYRPLFPDSHTTRWGCGTRPSTAGTVLVLKLLKLGSMESCMDAEMPDGHILLFRYECRAQIGR